uniref:Galactose-1-phosphate uridylyltransferase n=1 Tax=Trichuris muris TaxID=70415 RepID=A0A5S6Q4G5_TRIMR
MLNLPGGPHRRYNPLKDEWVIVAPQRLQRPWKGEEQRADALQPRPNDNSNALLPRTQRSSGIVNPDYEQTFCFANDFPALDGQTLLFTNEEDMQHDPLFRTEPAPGACLVLCYHRCSEKHFASMSSQEIEKVVDCWIEQLKTLSADHDWVQIFENRGAAVGCSNGHPHGQVWATKFLPNIPSVMNLCQKKYHYANNGCLLVDYAKKEMADGTRTVLTNDHWLIVVPFWAVWPFETMLLPRRHVLRLTDLTDDEKTSLSDALGRLLRIYDGLFETPFPYSMGWYGAPTGRYLHEDMNHWQLHAVFLPPLLRSATVKKFMAGFELLCEPQRDLTPESAAQRLRVSAEKT